MRRALALALFSRRPLSPATACAQITALSEFAGGLVRPDKAAEFEPIRTAFDPENLQESIAYLSKPGGAFMYRKGRPTYASGVIWNLSHPPTARFPGRLFANYWTGEFDGTWAKKIGIEKVEDFLVEMFRVSSSDLALLTTECDLQAKNRTPLVSGHVQSLSYKGLDLEHGIPGLYWINLFSCELATWLRLSELPKNLGSVKPLGSGAVLLKFGESPEDGRSFHVLQQQRLAIEWLGSEKFFDIRFPDRKLEAPKWDESGASGRESRNPGTGSCEEIGRE
jgi:hypothetical protein